ncbi:type II secretion system protein D precursor [mine drainage metagenome]|uniref:Type II secretion system protein D n=1 Tax=mine drainage metagenome TaxID=410659 RepID=A0A1J5T9Q1_9ZZZZ
MNAQKYTNSRLSHHCGKILAATLGIVLIAGEPLYAADTANTTVAVATNTDKTVSPVKSPKKSKSKARVKKPMDEHMAMNMPMHNPPSTEITQRMDFSLGESHLFRLPVGRSLQKVKIDDEKVVNIDVTSPREVVIHAKAVGSTSVIIWDKSGGATVLDVMVVGVNVGVDAPGLQSKLHQLLPNESGIKVNTAADSLVLSGTVSDAVKADKALALAEAYAGKDKDKKVINMLQVAAPQQVMLEVKMAEVSKNLLDKLGAQFNASRVNGGVAYAIAAGFLSLTGANPLSPGGLVTVTHGNTSIKVDAENKDGIVKILAEPNIIAISGQEGSFLAGGKLFIPVPQTNAGGLSTITLEEKEFGIGLKFTPTVLEDGLINLRVAPEVSELSQSGTEVVAGAGRSVLPSFVTRRASTTVQLRDGQSFAIAGLIKNNVTETIRRFPVLGNIPILGALFRSSEFQNDKTELIFVVTPRLVKPLPPNYSLPTDNFKQPNKTDFFLNGKLEASPKDSDAPAAPTDNAPAPNAPAPQPDAVVPQQPATKDGFEMK